MSSDTIDFTMDAETAQISRLIRYWLEQSTAARREAFYAR